MCVWCAQRLPQHSDQCFLLQDSVTGDWRLSPAWIKRSRKTRLFKISPSKRKFLFKQHDQAEQRTNREPPAKRVCTTAQIYDRLEEAEANQQVRKA